MDLAAVGAAASLVNEAFLPTIGNDANDERKSSPTLRKTSHSIDKKPLRVIALICFLTIVSFLIFFIQKLIYIFEYASSNHEIMDLMKLSVSQKCTDEKNVIN